MPSDRPASFSSAFDAVLDRNRQELDALYSGSRSGFDHTAGVPPPKASATSATSTPAPPSAPVAPRPSPAGTRGTFDASVSTTARELDRRFHGDWRCEVAEQIEEGGEVIVLCKLRIRSKNIIRSQFGSARISGAAGASGAQVKGAADGVSFALDTEGSQHPGASESAREAAFQGAMEQALAHCLETL